MFPTRLAAGAAGGTAVVVAPGAAGATGCLVFKVLARRVPMKCTLHVSTILEQKYCATQLLGFKIFEKFQKYNSKVRG